MASLPKKAGLLLESFSFALLTLASGCGKATPMMSSCVFNPTCGLPDTIVLTPAFPQNRIGGLQGFKATGLPGSGLSTGPSQDLTTSVSWSSSVPTVAMIDASGAATGLSDGETVIQASLNGVTAWTVLTIWEANAFVPTGNSVTARSTHTATLLNNGKVLIVGTFPASTNAELFDPTVGTFTATGNLVTPRSGHTATLLQDGRVLIAGGYQVSGSIQTGIGISSAEIYDPVSGTFTATSSMITPRGGPTATRLSNGKVLIAGGGGAPSPTGLTSVASAELYDPSTGIFITTGSMSRPRSGHTATLLNTGKVVIAGGNDPTVFPGASLATAELYDPASGTFSSTASMSGARQEHTATLLNDGTVLIIGGISTLMPNVELTTAELYDPANGTFSFVGSMFTGRSNHTATLLNDGFVLVTGGMAPLNALGNPAALGNSELYNPGSRTFGPTAAMTAPRDQHTATLLNDGTVLVVGGESQAAQTAERYR